MFLIIGGQSQGKLEYVLKTTNINLKDIANCEYDNIDNIFKKKIIYNFHLYIKKLLEKNINAFDLIKKNLKEDSEKIIICNEIGLGIVPLSKEERKYREEVGRICIYLAQISEKVERVCCGIPITIKEI